MLEIKKPFDQNVLDCWREEKDSTGLIIAKDKENNLFYMNPNEEFRFEKLFPKDEKDILSHFDSFPNRFECEEAALVRLLDKGWQIFWFEGRDEFMRWMLSRAEVDFEKEFC